MKKKILILTNSDSGLYQFRGELISKLAVHYEVVCCTPNEDGFMNQLKHLGCRCLVLTFDRRGVNPFHDMQLINIYRKLLKREKPDVVLTYTIKPNVYGGMMCAHLNLPYITNITGLGDILENGGLLKHIATNLYKIGLKKSSCVFFQNDSNQQFFLKNRIIDGKTRLIPGSGVNIEKHCFEDYPTDDSTIRFLFVARVKKDKGIEELLAAIHGIRIEKQGCIVDIVGRCEDNYKDELKDAEKQGDIHYYGQQRDVHSFYKNCHCVVLPSYHEGMSNVLLEGAATGRPVIATRVPGCQEIFDEGVSGLGCEPRNIDSLKGAMLKFISLSQEKRRGMGLAARVKMEQKYDRNIVLSAYLDEIRRATGKVYV